MNGTLIQTTYLVEKLDYIKYLGNMRIKVILNLNLN